MELSELNQTFFERTPVVVALKDGDGEFKEETLTVYHTGFTEDVLKAWLEVEQSEAADTPKVTRQLLASKAQVKEFTHEGKPVVMDADKWAIVGVPAQRTIANQLWLATFGGFTPDESSAETKEKGKRVSRKGRS